MRTKEYVWCQNKDNMGGATGYILNLKGNLTDSTVWNTGETGDSSSSILVYLFLQHAVHNCSTWMTSCVQFEKNEG